jgi:hypothetical protein
VIVRWLRGQLQGRGRRACPGHKPDSRFEAGAPDHVSMCRPRETAWAGRWTTVAFKKTEARRMKQDGLLTIVRATAESRTQAAR